MKQLTRVFALLFAFVFLAPALALAQTDSTTSVSVQVQSLLSQITSLEQELKTLVQTATPSSTPSMWNGNPSQNGSTSTPPTPPAAPPTSGNRQGGGMMMGNCSGFSRNLSMGSEGSDVMQLQQVLSGDGFLSASSTGIFGPLTAKALEMFQVSFGITSSSSASGFFGPLTRTFLEGHCGGMGSSTPPMAGHGPATGSSTPPMWQQGSSTQPMNGTNGWNMGTSTHPMPMGPIGSSTPPNPCPQNANEGAALGLLALHIQLPTQFMGPCAAPSSAQQ